MVREGRAGAVGLKARDSPREKQQRDRRDWKTHLIFILYCNVCPWCGQSQGGRRKTWANIHRDTHRNITHMNAMCSYVIQVREKKIKNYFFCLVINSYACTELHAVQVILLTCDLPYGTEYIKLFWVQRFNVVVDIPENDNGRLEKTNKNLLITAWLLTFKLHAAYSPKPNSACRYSISPINVAIAS